MTEKVGLVHQMPFVCDRPGFAGALEKVYFGTCHCRMYLFINLIGVNCVTGMSCLMRKCVLEKLGGLQYFAKYIAEDYFIGQAYLDHGWRILLSHQPAMQNSASYSIPTWQKRMIRWCKLRLKLTVLSWLEPIQECFMLGICTSWTVSYLFGWNSLVFFLIHVLGWFLSDYTLLKITQVNFG
jgi:ceramide glucosyltransferase